TAAEFRLEAESKRAAFDSWCQEVARLTPLDQVQAVTTKLRELNPGFSGRLGRLVNGEVEYRIQGTQVVEFKVPSEDISDISPVRALPNLILLSCEPRNFMTGTGKLSDLGPLRGMSLRILHCAANPSLSDLTPLTGMKLEVLAITRTGVT